MNRTYLNCPSVGSVMTAEEFAAQNGFAQGWGNQGGGCGSQTPAPGSGCGGQQAPGNGCGPQIPPSGPCGCAPQPSQPSQPVCCGQSGGAAPALNGGFNVGNGAGLPGGLPLGPGPAAGGFGQSGCQPMVCCCQPVACPQPAPPQVEEGGCCCKESFRAALNLLCNPTLASLLDFDAAAVVTRTYIAGAAAPAPTPQAIAVGAAASDNLGGALTGSVRRLAPCNGDLLEITGTLTDLAGADTAIPATQVNLCQLVGVAIDLAEAEAVGDITAEAVQAQNLRIVQQTLAQGMPSSGGPCGGGCQCCCPSDDGCCCANGLLCSLAQSNLSRRVSLAAGPLQINGATLVGSIGNVLVLSNDEDNRIYFVCVNEVEYLF